MHWYDAKTGEPRYKIPYANGKGEKTPTLADAKRNGYVPSVTSVLGILDKPGLNNWKVEQAILAALTHPNLAPELTHEEMMRAIKQDAARQAKEAAQRGTDIHAAIEVWLLGSQECFSQEWIDIAIGAELCLSRYADYNETDKSWQIEARLPGNMGYGGKVDLHSNEWIIDFKTKEFSQEDIDAGKVRGWPEQEVQLTAYDHGLGGPRRRRANVFVSVTEPGLCHFYEWPPEGYDVALRRWFATLGCWYAWKWPTSEHAAQYMPTLFDLVEEVQDEITDWEAA